jgi:hypothetical protein
MIFPRKRKAGSLMDGGWSLTRFDIPTPESPVFQPVSGRETPDPAKQANLKWIKGRKFPGELSSSS